MDRKRIMTTYCLIGLLVIAAAGLAYIKIASISETDSKTDIVMAYDSTWNPERLSDLYGQMLSNYEAGETWKNIPAAKEKVKGRRQLKAWEIVLLALGSPIWISLLVAGFVVILSIYISNNLHK